METQFQQEPKVPFFQTTTAKMIMVGILTIVLIIPLALVQELIVERSQRKKKSLPKPLLNGEIPFIFTVQF